MSQLHHRDGSYSFFTDEEWEQNCNTEDTRRCSKCGLSLSNSEFSRTSGGNYLRPECRKCNNKLSKVRESLKERYGMPPLGYICPICGQNEAAVMGHGNAKNGAWVIDHNHNDDSFRGWLCHKCNRTLGGFDDDPALLTRAVCYLIDMPMYKADFILYTINRLNDETALDADISRMVYYDDTLCIGDEYEPE